MPPTTPQIDPTSNPYVRLEFVKDTVHNYARRRPGDKPELWFAADEAQKLVDDGIAKIDPTAKTWGEALAESLPRELPEGVDNGPRAGERPVDRRAATGTPAKPNKE